MQQYQHLYSLIPVLLIVGVLVVSGCAGNTPQDSDSASSDTDTTSDTAPANTEPENTNSGEGSDGTVKELSMTAKQFTFEPNTVTVNQGDTVRLHITSTDVDHGIAIPAFGVSQTLPAGEEKTVEFVADKKGTYEFICNVYCGSGHGNMKGTLVVK